MKTYIPLTLISVAIVCSGAYADYKVSPVEEEYLQEMRHPNQPIGYVKPDKTDPGDTYAASGLHKYAIEDYKGALSDCTKALAAHPKDKWWTGKAYNIRYHAYIKLKDWNHALSSAIECFKNNADSKVAEDISKLYKIQGDEGQSKKYLELSIKLRQEFQKATEEGKW